MNKMNEQYMKASLLMNRVAKLGYVAHAVCAIN